MKMMIRIILGSFVLCLFLIPVDVFAHHLSQGYGSAPDVVDDYAHGANAQADNQGGYNTGTVDEGSTNAMNGPGGMDDDEGGESSGGDSDSDSDGSGSGSGSSDGNGNGNGNGRS